MEQTETAAAAPLEITVSLENTTPGIMKDDNSENRIPLTNVVEELSIENSSPSEKSHDDVELVDSCQISVDAEPIAALEAERSLENRDTVSNEVLEDVTAVVEKLTISSTEELSSQEIQPEVDSSQKSVDYETIAALETKLPLEPQEYPIPVGTVIEELSTKSPDEASLPVEKSNDAEKLPEVVKQVDSNQKSVDYEAIATLETKLPLEPPNLIPVGTVIEELSIKSPKEVSLPVEKSNDAEKLPEVEQVDSDQKSIDDKKDEDDRWCTLLPKDDPFMTSRLARLARLRSNSSTLKNNNLLCSSKNAQVPTDPILVSKNLQADEKITKDLYESVTKILNRISEENWLAGTSRIKTLPITNAARLQSVIDLIHDKAIGKPDDCQYYAKMCRKMQHLTVPDEGSGKTQTFRTLLINKCQQVFEREMDKELDVTEKQKEIDVCTDPEIKKKLQTLFEKNVREFHRKAIGNCRFLGELFKLQVLIDEIMLLCIAKLLGSADEISLECLCELLTTIGRNEARLTTVQKKKFESFFDKMRDLSKDKYKVLSRIRFMLQDVINLRKNGWVSMHEVDDCKKVEQIDAEHKPKEQDFRTLNLQPSRRNHHNYGYGDFNTKGIYPIPAYPTTLRPPPANTVRSTNQGHYWRQQQQPQQQQQAAKASTKYPKSRIKIINPETGEEVDLLNHWY